MASTTITIPDNVLQRVLDGFAKRNNYAGKAPDGSDETKAQFLKRLVIQYVKDAVATQEAIDAGQAASNAADAAARGQIAVT